MSKSRDTHPRSSRPKAPTHSQLHRVSESEVQTNSHKSETPHGSTATHAKSRKHPTTISPKHGPLDPENVPPLPYAIPAKRFEIYPAEQVRQTTTFYLSKTHYEPIPKPKRVSEETPIEKAQPNIPREKACPSTLPPAPIEIDPSSFNKPFRRLRAPTITIDTSAVNETHSRDDNRKRENPNTTISEHEPATLCYLHSLTRRRKSRANHSASFVVTGSRINTEIGSTSSHVISAPAKSPVVSEARKSRHSHAGGRRERVKAVWVGLVKETPYWKRWKWWRLYLPNPVKIRCQTPNKTESDEQHQGQSRRREYEPAGITAALKHKRFRSRGELPHQVEYLGERENVQECDESDLDTTFSIHKSQHDVDTEGRRSLVRWKHAAGKSKCWRRCKRITTSRFPSRRDKMVTKNKLENDRRFFTSPLWLPSLFLQSQGSGRSQGVKMQNKPQAPDRKSKKKRISLTEGLTTDDEPATPAANQCQFRECEYEEQNQDPLDPQCNYSEPPPVFIRFTWVNGSVARGVGELDRFLPSGLHLRSHWRVVRFLRNDPHADIYSVLDNKLSSSPQAGAEEDLELHVFLDTYYGNSETYAKKHKRRMRESGNCKDSFWYNGRHVFVVKTLRRQEPFQLRNTEENFPSLVDQKQIVQKKRQQARAFCGKPSYAFVVKVGLLSEGAAGIPSCPELAETTARPGRKAQKQRSKRRTQRQAQWEAGERKKITVHELQEMIRAIREKNGMHDDHKPYYSLDRASWQKRMNSVVIGDGRSAAPRMSMRAAYAGWY